MTLAIHYIVEEVRSSQLAGCLITHFYLLSLGKFLELLLRLSLVKSCLNLLLLRSWLVSIRLGRQGLQIRKLSGYRLNALHLLVLTLESCIELIDVLLMLQGLLLSILSNYAIVQVLSLNDVVLVVGLFEEILDLTLVMGA